MSVSDDTYDWGFHEMSRYYIWKERTTNQCVKQSGKHHLDCECTDF